VSEEAEDRPEGPEKQVTEPQSTHFLELPIEHSEQFPEPPVNELEEPPFEFPGETRFEDEPELTKQSSIEETAKSFVVESSAAKLVPIPLEELEHVEDKRLDADFERVMSADGDDLRPIGSLMDILNEHFGVVEKQTPDETPFSAEKAARSNKAVEIALKMGSDDEEVTELPDLSENPDEEELIAYAEHHPAVRNVLKLFKGKVVGAKKK
jgi:hypothetical protein